MDNRVCVCHVRAFSCAQAWQQALQHRFGAHSKPYTTGQLVLTNSRAQLWRHACRSSGRYIMYVRRRAHSQTLAAPVPSGGAEVWCPAQRLILTRRVRIPDGWNRQLYACHFAGTVDNLMYQLSSSSNTHHTSSALEQQASIQQLVRLNISD